MIDSIHNWLQNSVFLRLLFIAFVLLLLLIPISMIGSQIYQHYNTKVVEVDDIHSTREQQQSTSQPRLVGPYENYNPSNNAVHKHNMFNVPVYTVNKDRLHYVHYVHYPQYQLV